MIDKNDLQDWHHSRIEALLLDVADQLIVESEATVSFAYPRPASFQRAVLQQLQWHGYIGRLERDLPSGLLLLVVRRSALI
jgi:hypothetical protein